MAGIRALVIKIVSSAERTSQTNFAVTLHRGWDDVGDAPAVHVGGPQDRTRLALSGQWPAGHYFHLWLLGIQVAEYMNGRRRRRKLGACLREEETSVLPSTSGRPPLPGSLQCQKEMLPGWGWGVCAPATSARLALTVTGLLDRAATTLSHTGMKRAQLCISSHPDSPAAELSG